MGKVFVMTKDEKIKDWWLRLVKGLFLGSGFIIPGISGGALAAIFGIYQRIIVFLANITENFKENVRFFLPVGIGAVISIVILSWGVSYLLGNFATVILWFFVGCIVGTVPSLWREAGKEGRDKKDYIITLLSMLFGLAVLKYGNTLFDGSVTPSFGIWIVCGVLISLGMLIPGLSPSNFIVYMGLYKTMADGFKTIDMSVIIPIVIGALLTIASLSKVINHIFETHYASFFHFIFGVVIASTIMIVPTDYTGFTLFQYGMCVLLLVLGTLLGWWMAQLEEKYK